MDLIAAAETLEAQAAALRRFAAKLGNETPLAEPQEQPWIDWEGGDAPPEDARGKLVDVRFRNGEIQQPAPAAVWEWSHLYDYPYNIVAYRISAEQPDAE